MSSKRRGTFINRRGQIHPFHFAGIRCYPYLILLAVAFLILYQSINWNQDSLDSLSFHKLELEVGVQTESKGEASIFDSKRGKPVISLITEIDQEKENKATNREQPKASVSRKNAERNKYGPIPSVPSYLKSGCVSSHNDGKYVLGNMFFQEGLWGPDFITSKQQQNEKIHSSGLTDSFGARYLASTDLLSKPSDMKGKRIRFTGNVTFMNEIIRQSSFPRASSDAVLIHLRLGDNMRGESFFRYNNFNSGKQAPRPKAFYQDLLESLLQQRRTRYGSSSSSTTVDSIITWPPIPVILMGSHCSGGWKINEKKLQFSLKYEFDLTNFIKNFSISNIRNTSGLLEDKNLINVQKPLFEVVRKISVVTSENISAVDADVAFASTVGSFVCSGGSFSHMLAALVLENGGHVYGCNNSTKYQELFRNYSVDRQHDIKQEYAWLEEF